jgi:site-specific DNA recombinase
MKRLAGYIRVSKVNGREGESFHSPEKQRAEVEARAKQLGAEVVRWYEDLDESGKEGNPRPELAAMMAAFDRGEFGGIVVAKLSRFGRSVADGLKLVKRINDAGGEFIAVDLGVDTRTANGRMILNILLTLAEWELERAREEWLSVRQRAHKAPKDGEPGAVHLAPTPVGYARSDGKRSRLVVVDELRPVVRRAFELRAEGQSYQAVADFMREGGHPMSKSGVGAMLASRVYLGDAAGAEKGEWTPDAHEAIVPEDLWEAANHVKAKAIRNGSIASKGMLTRIIACAGCGKTMSVSASPGKREGVYVCRSRERKEPCPSPTSVRIPVADDYVRESITTALVDGTLRATTDAIRLYNARAEAVERARADRDALVAERGPLPLDAWKRMVLAAEAALEAALDALHATPAPDNIVEPDSLLWDKWDIEDERAFARQVISEVRVTRAAKRGRWGSVADRIEIRWAGHDDFDTSVHARGAEARETAARLRAA